MTETEKMHEVAHFLEGHPTAPRIPANVAVWLYNKDDAIKAAKLPGATKEYSDYALVINVPVTDDLKLQYYINREKVCTATEIKKTWIPEQEGHYVETPVAWDCHPLLQPTEDGKAVEALLQDATPAPVGGPDVV